MLNIGAGEIALIAVVALLILGPSRLPELARGIGKFLREFRRQTDEVRTVVEREFYRMDQEIDRVTSLEPGATASPHPGDGVVPFGNGPLAGMLPPHEAEAEATRTDATSLHPDGTGSGAEDEHTHPDHPAVAEPADEQTVAATQTRARAHAEQPGSEPVVPQAKSRSG